MTKISSKATFFFKKLFPIIWIGFLAAFVIGTTLHENVEQDAMSFLGPCLMAGFGLFLMKKLVWDLADEVYDCGEFLLVKNAGEEDRVSLSNIMNVSASTNTNPPRVTLRLVRPGKFGNELAFSPVTQLTFNPFAKNRIAEDLMIRVDQARVRRVV